MCFETRRFAGNDILGKDDCLRRKCLEEFYKNNKCIVGCKEPVKKCCCCFCCCKKNFCGFGNVIKENCKRFINAPLTIYGSEEGCGNNRSGEGKESCFCPCGGTSSVCFTLPMPKISPPTENCNKEICYIPPKVGYCYITPKGFLGIKALPEKE